MTGYSLDQCRARHALARIKEIQQKEPPLKQSNYLSYVKALPASILQNGLGQAMATLLAAAKTREDDPHFLLYRDVQSWLCGKDKDAPYREKQDLLQAIVSHDQQHYLRAQAEAQCYLNWLKKLAAAFLKARDDGDSNDG